MEVFESNNVAPRERNIDCICIYFSGEKLKGQYIPKVYENKGLSNHYYIKSSGKIICSVEEQMVASHSMNIKLNDRSVGIMLLIEGDFKNMNHMKEELNKSKRITNSLYENLIYVVASLMREYPLITINDIHINIQNKYSFGSIDTAFDEDYFYNSLKKKLSYGIDDTITFKSIKNDVINFIKRTFKW